MVHHILAYIRNFQTATIGHAPSLLIYTTGRPYKGCKKGRLLEVWVLRIDCGFAYDKGSGSLTSAGVSCRIGADKVEPVSSLVDFSPMVLRVGRKATWSFLSTLGGATVSWPWFYVPSLLVFRRGESSLEKSRGDFSTVDGVPEELDNPVASSMAITRVAVQSIGVPHMPRAQLDDRHVSHLAFDGSDRMVGEMVVGPPILSSPFLPFLGSFNKITWYKNKVLYTRITAYSDQTRPNPTFVSTSWRHPWDPTLGITLTRMSAMANATPIVTTVTKTTNKEKAPDAAPGVNIVDFCEEYYEDILPIIMDKARRDKRKEVQTRLNFGENNKRTRRERENSLNSRAENSPTRVYPERSRTRGRERRDDRNVFSRLSHRRKSVHERLSNTYSPSTTKSGPSRTDSRDPSHSRGHHPRRERPRIEERSRSAEESYGDTYSQGTKTKYRDRSPEGLQSAFIMSSFRQAIGSKGH
ncbi:hypothetical protein Tco_0639781 [Tanacetum coccineum]